MNEKHQTMDCGHDSLLPDDLEDEAAARILAFLYNLAAALENRYAAQIMRYYRNIDPEQPELPD